MKKSVKFKLTWVELQMLKSYVEGVINTANTQCFTDKLIAACLQPLLIKLVTKSVFYSGQTTITLKSSEALALHEGYQKILPLNDLQIQRHVGIINQAFI